MNSLLDQLYWLRQQLEKLPESRPRVQTHGSYNPSHIFIAPGVTTAIDLDRSRVSDPAKDIAEFISALGSAAFGLGWGYERLDRLTGAFLEEYLSLSSRPPGLSYYRSAYTLLHLCGGLREAGLDDSAAAELVKYYMRALEAAPA